MKTYKVAARSSALARIQVDEALGLIKAGGAAFNAELRYLDSWGDRHQEISMMDGSAPGDIFTRDLDELLRGGEADFAIHSAKDLDLPLARDMRVFALLPAADQSDCIAVADGRGPGLEDLPTGARIGTSSAMRKAEILARRPDVKIESIRGTIEQRLDQMDRGKYDAVIIATCALNRLGLDARISRVLPFTTNPLQGHLAVTGLSSRRDLDELWAPLDVRRGDSPPSHEVMEMLPPPRIWYSGINPDRFERFGRITARPLIRTAPVEDPAAAAEADEVLKMAGDYDWIIFTSRQTLRYTAERLAFLRQDTDGRPKIAAVGRSTARDLKERGFPVDLIPERESSLGLVQAFKTAGGFNSGDRVLVPSSNLALPVIARGLTELGARVDRLKVYRTETVEAAPVDDLDELDEVVLTSPSGARAFHHFYPDPPDDLLLVPMGEQTLRSLQALFPGRKMAESLLPGQNG